MKHIIIIFIFLCTYTAGHAQFRSVSTNLTGWAAGNINVAVDLNLNRHNTINIPVSCNPFAFGDTQWKHIALQPGWRHWFVERYVGHFISPSVIYANYNIRYDKQEYKGNAFGVGFSWGYSVLLNTRWSFIVEMGAGIIYTPYDQQLLPQYIGEFDTEYIYHHRRVMFVPAKCNLSFSYLF